MALFRIPFIIASLFLLTFLTCHPGYAQTLDCDSAEKACKADCPRRSIYDNVEGKNLEQTDFAKRCERACAEGTKNCRGEDSTNGCDSYNYHCIGACPWEIIDKYIDMSVSSTDAFAQCAQSCSAGLQSCKQVLNQVKPRRRDAQLDPCLEGQVACYATCGSAGLGGDFPDVCAKACAAGFGSCQVPKGKEACADFDDACAGACPDVTWEDEIPEGTSEAGKKCLNACYAGWKYCERIFE